MSLSDGNPTPDAPPQPHLLLQDVEKVTHYGDTAAARSTLHKLCFPKGPWGEKHGLPRPSTTPRLGS